MSIKLQEAIDNGNARIEEELRELLSFLCCEADPDRPDHCDTCRDVHRAVYRLRDCIWDTAWDVTVDLLEKRIEELLRQEPTR